MPITLTLNVSEAVNVTGTPTLTLNDGGTATYVSGTGTNALTFRYIAADPAGSQSGLNQQGAMFSQSMASFAPSEGGGTSENAPPGFYAGQLPNLAQPVANQQHV
jgi:hypothetical protein